MFAFLLCAVFWKIRQHRLLPGPGWLYSNIFKEWYVGVQVNCVTPPFNSGANLGKAFDIGKRLQGSTFYAAVTLKVRVVV